MPETHLILHVKGTEAETTQVPVEAVRTAIAHGELTESQLIWSPEENTWKQVRELPHLREEVLTLHVKGTEKETVVQPRKAVRAEIARGNLSHSQLIWSPAENTWKQVRELPDLLPSQKLAPAPARLPVEAAPPATVTPDSPTSPVARVAVKASQTPSGATRSLTPKARPQVVEAPRVIPQVHVVPPESGTPPSPRIVEAPRVIPQVHVASEASADGSARIPVAVAVQPSIASATAKISQRVPQVRAVSVAPSGLSPVPAATVTPVAVPQVRVASATPVPKVSASAAGIPAAKVKAVAARPNAKAGQVTASGPRAHHVVRSDDGPHPIKWLCFGLCALILILVGGNYLFVSQPLSSGMQRSTFGTVPVFAHLGAFVQPNVVVIHVRPAGVTPDNVTTFLVALAGHTPPSPFTHDSFDRVALTTGWLAHFTISGGGWRQLGDMADESQDEQKKLLLELMGDAGGQKLLEPSATLDHDAMQARRDKAWAEITSYFTAK